MILFKKSSLLAGYLQKARNKGKSIGFVPTMGALHPGHISLVETSTRDNPLTVVSIFVNPTQFNDKKDFEKYPVTIEKDIELLVASGTEIVFLPDVGEVYPGGYDTYLPPYNLGYLETVLEGKYRPGHFQGVCRVMNRLLDIVQPNNLYMGQKDYQQCMVVQRLLNILHSTALLLPCPILREKDGLAMSSRNTRLGIAERKKAPAIFLTLNHIKKNIQPGGLSGLLDECTALLTANDFRVDYVSIADAQTLEPVTHWNGTRELVALIAAFQDEVRLIDNLLLNKYYRPGSSLDTNHG
ncbi:MAG: pantoate--beta-alanine ligase [Bacteroidota bacterium]